MDPLDQLTQVLAIEVKKLGCKGEAFESLRALGVFTKKGEFTKAYRHLNSFFDKKK